MRGRVACHRLGVFTGGGGGVPVASACGAWAQREKRRGGASQPGQGQRSACVYGVVCGVPCAGGLRTSWVGVCVSGVRMCVCAVCRRGVRAGMRVVCRVFLWVVRAETEAESRSQAKDDAVGVWYGHGVCVGGGGGGPACGACGVCGGRAETDRVRQRITCMDGYPASSACVF